ncbi:MAG TPA: hypothetical protein VNK70_03175 [Candidatus Paceibacterota bacterium]|nr:hypothetical protein [Candidatus Paceibacterota bacterium]
MFGIARCVPAIENILHTLEEFFGNDRLMLTFGNFALPAVHPAKERIAHVQVHERGADFVSAARAHAHRVHFIGKLFDRVRAGGVKLEHLAHERRALLVYHVDFMPFLAHGFVADRRL